MAAIWQEYLKCISMYENGCIFIRIWLKFVPKDPKDDELTLFQIMAWRRLLDPNRRPNKDCLIKYRTMYISWELMFH